MIRERIARALDAAIQRSISPLRFSNCDSVSVEVTHDLAGRGFGVVFSRKKSVVRILLPFRSSYVLLHAVMMSQGVEQWANDSVL